MITKERFDLIKKKYGKYASWAVWAEPEHDKPKSKMGDLTILDPEINKDLLSQLNPNVVLVALNFSRDVVHPDFGNFHNDYPYATDYKTRYALKNTRFWGAYMTDIVKNHGDRDSNRVSKFLEDNKSIEKENVEFFRQEIEDIGAEKPDLVAFGKESFKILKRNLAHEFKILQIPHYANYTSKETYREQVKTIC